MTEWTVREATPADLPGVAVYWKKLQEYHLGLGLIYSLPDDAADKWVDSFKRTLGRFSFLWVAGPEGAPVAFLLCRVKQSPAYFGGMQVGQLSDMYVDDSLRGTGVGRMLGDEAMKKFAELGVHSIEGEVQLGNEVSLNFWAKYGFTVDTSIIRKVMKP
ncbi:MAG: GNAT family N-acetyltransferase [Anaerolineales bacterium]|nr:GNAT family N-acetyltransferase [Anaerolineales bacterium]